MKRNEYEKPTVKIAGLVLNMWCCNQGACNGK